MRLLRYDLASPTKERRAAFSSGHPSLDRWLATQAGQSMRSRDAVTYLLVDDDADDRIAGYFCLSAGSVRRGVAPAGIDRRAPDPVPVVRMGRFAIDEVYQGQGWGADLLREALLSSVSGSEVIGARAVVVDAIDDRAARFYLRFGFLHSPTHPRQLFRTLTDIRRSAGLD